MKTKQNDQPKSDLPKLASPAQRALAGAGMAVVAGMAFVRRHQAALEEEAERAWPGPLPPPGRLRHRDEPHP